MTDMLRIEPVKPSQRHRALGFIAAGAPLDRPGKARAEALTRAVESSNVKATRVWWARKWRRCLAAAAVLESSGRAGTLMFSPLWAPGVDAEVLVSVIRAVSRDALAGGLALIQTIHHSSSEPEIDAVHAAGYHHLADMSYLRLRLPSSPPTWDDANLTWYDYDQLSQEELGRLIEATYEGTQDCPELCGTREIGDVIASHKNTGVFCPQTWWTVKRDGEPAGCILVNESRDRRDAQVVYIGVVPTCRRAGIGRAMLRRAQAASIQKGLKAMTLAADTMNDRAMGLYRSEGFAETDRKAAYVMLRGDM